MPMVLSVPSHHKILINGALLEVSEKRATFAVLSPDTRVLHGPMVLSDDALTTPIRRLYYAVQHAYAGLLEERAQNLERASALFIELRRDASFELAHELDTAKRLVESGGFYSALKVLRDLISEEDKSSDKIKE